MSTDKITVSQLTIPFLALSLAVVIFLGFQSGLLLKDRDSLHAARAQQDKPLEQVEKVKAQVSALAMGTLRLSEQGNKDATAIIAELKKIGVDIGAQPPQQQPPAAPQLAPAQ